MLQGRFAILVVWLVVACWSAPLPTAAPSLPSAISPPAFSPASTAFPTLRPSESTQPATTSPTLTPTISPGVSPTAELELPAGGEWTVGSITSPERLAFPSFNAIDAGGLGFVVVGGRVVEFPAQPELGEYAVATAYHSRDGTTWHVVELPTYDGLDRAEGVAVGDVAVAVGCTGCVSVGGAKPAITGIAWTSSDGISWQLQQAFGVGSVPSTVIALASGFLVLGTTGNSWSDESAVAPTVWTSSDGLAWGGPHEVCSDCTVSDVIEHQGQLLALGSVSDKPELWISEDGRAWRSLEADVPQGVNRIVSLGEGLLGLGYVCAPVDPNRPESPNVCEGVLATSGDGVAWIRTGSRLVNDLMLFDGVVVDGALLVVGHDRSDNLVVLNSIDGSDWDPVDDLFATNAAAGTLHVATYNNIVVVTTTGHSGSSRLLATSFGG